MKKIILSILSCLGIISACADEKPKALLIELDIFSGRPNPTFVVTDPKVITELLSLAQSTGGETVSPAKPAPAPLLGYKGFIIENTSSTNPEIESISVYRTSVSIQETDPAHGLASKRAHDANRRLEKRLIQLIKDHEVITDEIVRLIDQ